MLGVRLDNELEKNLSRYAKKTRQSKSVCVKQALREFLEKKAKEEEHDQKTLLGWKQIEQGDEVPLKKVFSYLDSWGADEEI